MCTACIKFVSSLFSVCTECVQGVYSVDCVYSMCTVFGVCIQCVYSGYLQPVYRVCVLLTYNVCTKNIFLENR